MICDLKKKKKWPDTLGTRWGHAGDTSGGPSWLGPAFFSGRIDGHIKHHLLVSSRPALTIGFPPFWSLSRRRQLQQSPPPPPGIAAEPPSPSPRMESPPAPGSERRRPRTAAASPPNGDQAGTGNIASGSQSSVGESE